MPPPRPPWRAADSTHARLMPPRRVEIRFPGTHAGFEQAFDRLRSALNAQALEGAPRFNAELVFEEMVANVINHGAPDGRELDVCVTLEVGRESIVLCCDDDGVPFDPRNYPPPAPAKSLAEAKIGGFGLVLMHHAASSIDYLRTAAGRNRVTITVRRS
jgi:anti-sigma regulatory factor (Ser/Thr protein kinase)